MSSSRLLSQNTRYVVVSGARQKDEDWDPAENGGFAVHGMLCFRLFPICSIHELFMQTQIRTKALLTPSLRSKSPLMHRTM